MGEGKRIALCARCGNYKRHECRGLCKCCYNHVREGRSRSQETLELYPRVGKGSDLGAEGYNPDIAQQPDTADSPRHPKAWLHTAEGIDTGQQRRRTIE